MAHSVREASGGPLCRSIAYLSLCHVGNRIRRFRRAARIARRGFVGDVAAIAKRDLAAGETLDGEGGVALKRAANAGDTVRWDVAIDSALPAVRARRAMEARGAAV